MFISILFFVFISTSFANLHQTLSPLEAEIRQKAGDACKLMPTSSEKDSNDLKNLPHARQPPSLTPHTLQYWQRWLQKVLSTRRAVVAQPCWALSVHISLASEQGRVMVSGPEWVTEGLMLALSESSPPAKSSSGTRSQWSTKLPSWLSFVAEVEIASRAGIRTKPPSG